MLQPVLTVPVTVRFIAVPGKAMLMPVMLVVNRPAGNFAADASHWTTARVRLRARMQVHLTSPYRDA
jgi:hypothetical protein